MLIFLNVVIICIDIYADHAVQYETLGAGNLEKNGSYFVRPEPKKNSIFELILKFCLCTFNKENFVKFS